MADQSKTLFDCAEFFEGIRVFVTNREKIKHHEGTDLFDEFCRKLREAAGEIEQKERVALSHAAGQDGEQCRAASGFDLVAAMESWHSALDSAKELAINAPDDRYWKRANDVVAYLMTRAPNADSALSRGVPEGK